MMLSKKSNVSSKSQSMRSAQHAILKTLLYSDLFSFPLTKDELWKYLISDTYLPQDIFMRALQALENNSRVASLNGYYCLPHATAGIANREDHSSLVNKRLEEAKKTAKLLSMIPTIEYIGLSGSLAAGDVRSHDDIDLFIITKANTLFSTRLLIHAILGSNRRKPLQTSAPGKVCINLLVDTLAISWPRNERDVYVAREIAQLKPMFDRNNTYETFIKKNTWVRSFLPNAFDTLSPVLLHNKLSIPLYFPHIFEKIIRFIQISYMKKKRTTETVSPHRLAFHPGNYRSKILAEFQAKERDQDSLTTP